jgi:WD40 repeat protein
MEKEKLIVEKTFKGVNNQEGFFYEIQQSKAKMSEAKRLSPFKTLTSHLYGVSCLSYNNSTKELVSGSFDNTLNIYDINKFDIKSSLKGHTDGIWTCNYNEQNSILASGGSDKNIIFWDVNSGKSNSVLKYHDQTIYDIKFGQENSNLLLSCSKGKIALWDIKKTDKPINEIKNVNDAFVYSCNFLCHDSMIVFGYIDSNIVIYDLTSNKIKYEISVKYTDIKSEENQDSSNSVSK